MSRVETQSVSLPDITRAVRLPVRAFDNLIIDNVRAGLIRERDLGTHLKELRDTPAVIIDLSQIISLDVHAAFELLGKWIWILQEERKKQGKEPIPVVISARYKDILRTVHAALRDSGNSAFALIPKEWTGEETDELVQIGRIKTIQPPSVPPLKP